MIRLIGEITYEMFEKFSCEVNELVSDFPDTKEITVHLTSEGGNSYAALAIYSTIRRVQERNIKVKVRAYGYVASAATLILAAADIREVTKETWVMVHEDAGDLAGSVSQIENEAAHMRNLENQWNSLLEDRTETPAHKWQELHSKNTYLTPMQCLALGLATKIV